MPKIPPPTEPFIVITADLKKKQNAAMNYSSKCKLVATQIQFQLEVLKKIGCTFSGLDTGRLSYTFDLIKLHTPNTNRMRLVVSCKSPFTTTRT